MDTIFRFSSAQEISEEFIKKLKTFYKGVPVSITVKEDFKILDWQKEEVLKRQNQIRNHTESLTDFDEMIAALEKDRQDEN